MRAVIQRVANARVGVGDRTVGEIGRGLCVLLAVAHEDAVEDAAWMADRVCGLRIFADEEGRMNRSVEDVGGSVLLVSQFTLYGDATKGRRPSFTRSARSEHARALYETTAEGLRARLPGRLALGVFGADMQVSLVNDGPVTLILDSPAKPVVGA